MQYTIDSILEIDILICEVLRHSTLTGLLPLLQLNGSSWRLARFLLLVLIFGYKAPGLMTIKRRTN